jgi:hypothetical protein
MHLFAWILHGNILTTEFEVGFDPVSDAELGSLRDPLNLAMNKMLPTELSPYLGSQPEGADGWLRFPQHEVRFTETTLAEKARSSNAGPSSSATSMCRFRLKSGRPALVRRCSSLKITAASRDGPTGTSRSGSHTLPSHYSATTERRYAVGANPKLASRSAFTRTGRGRVEDGRPEFAEAGFASARRAAARRSNSAPRWTPPRTPLGRFTEPERIEKSLRAFGIEPRTIRH